MVDIETCYDLYYAARANRWVTFGKMVIGAVREARAMVRAAFARQRQRRRAVDICNALQVLDDRTLRDLGFDRSEIRSLAAEMSGDAQPTRLHVMQEWYGLPRLS